MSFSRSLVMYSLAIFYCTSELYSLVVPIVKDDKGNLAFVLLHSYAAGPQEVMADHFYVPFYVPFYAVFTCRQT